MMTMAYQSLRCLLLAAAGCGVAHGAEVVMAFSDSLPPYVMSKTDSGIELEVVSEALAYRHHVLVPRYLPMPRLALAFRAHQVDGIMYDGGDDLRAADTFYGSPAVVYNNVFITLKSRHLHIRKPSDLQGLSVIAFPGAARQYPHWLGDGGGTRAHTERNDPSSQPALLDLGRYDVVLCDARVYRHYLKEEQRRNPAFRPQPVQQHDFTEPDPRDYRPVFHDAAIRDDFDAGLRFLKRSGRYQAIYDKYMKG